MPEPEHTPDSPDTAQLEKRIKELEAQLAKAEKAGNDQRVQELDTRIAALEKRLEEADSPGSAPDDGDAEPEPEGVVLDASPEPNTAPESGQEAPAPKTITRRVGGRWRTWTEEPEPANV